MATDLFPLELLYDSGEAEILPLPETLARLYGGLTFPNHAERPYIIANFVETLDGVVALTDSGKAGGGPISGNNQHDRMVMGLLRAVSDAVIVASGTARLAPGHVWSAEHIFPDLSDEYHRLRSSIGKPERPLNIIVTASGGIEPSNRVFAGDVPVLIATTEKGAAKIDRDALPSSVEVRALAPDGPLSASTIVEATRDASGGDRFLLEGGPQLMASFFDERLVDEQFLTLAPQVAGRGDGERPGFVEGKTFAPDDPRWGTLVSVKRANEHLFIRYAFGTER